MPFGLTNAPSNFQLGTAVALAYLHGCTMIDIIFRQRKKTLLRLADVCQRLKDTKDKTKQVYVHANYYAYRSVQYSGSWGYFVSEKGPAG